MGILMYCILIAMNFMKIRQGVLAESLSIERKFGHDASLSFVKSKAPNSHKHTENSYIKPRNKRLRKRGKNLLNYTLVFFAVLTIARNQIHQHLSICQ